ncbi:MAG: TonB-dependent receptor [Elusimicrobia bacterium]|nr:MAG: TonB-dependent receptor [Elusimicrobiota bacterium]KAF0153684.1 MAG: TonB-dependent receptor [Elusimicrobiota bacterium]
MTKILSASLAVILSAAPAAASGSIDLDFFDFERASLEELLDIRTGVSSRMEFAAREAPGIITVITREELLNSGARNMIDALRLVPGLDFGVDVESLLGAGVRGNWGHEGKILVLVDGQRYNEYFLGTAQLERIPVEQVERIEVIRGPGSVVYGGSAGLGVIKVKTRGAGSIKRGAASASFGAMRGGPAGHTANLAVSGAGPDWELTAQSYSADLVRGDRRYTAFDGTSYSMKEGSGMETRNLNIGLRKGRLSARLLADVHRTWQRDGYSTSTYAGAMERNFDAYFGELKYRFEPAEALSIEPVLNYTYQEPYTGYDAAEYPREKNSHSLKGAVTAAYAASSRARLSGGAEASMDRAELERAGRLPAYMLFSGGKTSVNYGSAALFAEAVAEYGFGMVAAGLRYDKHEQFEAAFSPRLAWTKAMSESHFKAIYSGAFRAPAIDNLTGNPVLAPEKARVAEFEAGCRAHPDVYLTANIYDITIDDPIVFYSVGATQYYGNYGKTGTRGFELTSRLKKNWGYADLSYSYYAAAGNKVAYYDAGSDHALLGLAKHKLTLNASVKAREGFSLNPSAVWHSGRYGYYTYGLRRRYGDKLLANLWLARNGLLGGRLDAGLGVYDIFASGYSYLQPYDNGHAPLPAPSREIRMRLSYGF